MKSTRATPPRKFRLGEILAVRNMDGETVRARVVEKAVCKSFALARIVGQNELVILSPQNLIQSPQEQAA